VVNVEQGGLAGLEDDRLALVECGREQQPCVDDHRTHAVGILRELFEHLVDLDGATVVDLDQHLVLDLEGGLDLLAQDRLVEQVLHPDSDPRHLVGVGRPDAAPRGADPA